jgi:hypothetical protein
MKRITCLLIAVAAFAGRITSESLYVNGGLC